MDFLQSKTGKELDPFELSLAHGSFLFTWPSTDSCSEAEHLGCEKMWSNRPTHAPCLGRGVPNWLAGHICVVPSVELFVIVKFSSHPYDQYVAKHMCHCLMQCVLLYCESNVV